MMSDYCDEKDIKRNLRIKESCRTRLSSRIATRLIKKDCLLLSERPKARKPKQGRKSAIKQQSDSLLKATSSVLQPRSILVDIKAITESLSCKSSSDATIKDQPPLPSLLRMKFNPLTGCIEPEPEFNLHPVVTKDIVNPVTKELEPQYERKEIDENQAFFMRGIEMMTRNEFIIIEETKQNFCHPSRVRSSKESKLADWDHMNLLIETTTVPVTAEPFFQALKNQVGSGILDPKALNHAVKINEEKIVASESGLNVDREELMDLIYTDPKTVPKQKEGITRANCFRDEYDWIAKTPKQVKIAEIRKEKLKYKRDLINWIKAGHALVQKSVLSKREEMVQMSEEEARKTYPQLNFEAKVVVKQFSVTQCPKCRSLLRICSQTVHVCRFHVPDLESDDDTIISSEATFPAVAKVRFRGVTHSVSTDSGVSDPATIEADEVKKEAVALFINRAYQTAVQ